MAIKEYHKISSTIRKSTFVYVRDLKDIIFQDDQDRKQWTRVALDAVKDIFVNRIEPTTQVKKSDIRPYQIV